MKMLVPVNISAIMSMGTSIITLTFTDAQQLQQNECPLEEKARLSYSYRRKSEQTMTNPTIVISHSVSRMETKRCYFNAM
jgi:hypothetical protein